MLNIGEPVYRTCLLTWSEDQNIALTSSRIVYVCQLKSALHINELSSRNEPLTEIATATLPDGLGPIDVGITLPEHLRDEASKTIEQPIIRRYCSRKYRPYSQGTFRMSQWTPIGCSIHGGCLLTCLTNGDHVILFAPPPVFGYRWRKIKVISDALHDYWKSHYYGNIQSLNDDSFHELERRRRLMAVTSFIWLPGVNRNHENSTVVMVITTETSHVVFIRCVFDLLQREVNCTVDHVIQLPAQPSGWGCKLACLQHQDDIFVSIGCFNGNVHLLIVGGAARSFAYTDSQPRPVIDSNDNIPVIEMTWEKISKPSADHCILVVAKNQAMFVVRVPLMGGGIVIQGVVQGHVYPTSGLASLPAGHFLSCSRDKSILEFSPPDYQPYSVVGMANNIKTTPLDVSITGQPIGIATSHNGLFVAVAELVIGSRSFTHAHCKIHFIKLASQPNELIGYFENMVTMETPMYMCWDVFELLRQLLHINIALDIDSLLTPAILSGITEGNKYCLQLAKMIVVTAASCDREEPTVNNLSMEGLDFYCTINHVTECLSHWVNEPDVYTDIRDVDIVNSMLGWLTVFGSTASEALGEDVQVKLKRLSCVARYQLCPVCGAELNWTAYDTLECPSQHKWSSCHVTCTVLGRYNGRRCTQCGACTINGLQERELLLQHAFQICLRCGGLLKKL